MKMAINKKRSDFLKDLDQLIKNKRNFTFKASTYSREILTDNGLKIFYADDKINMSVFNVAKKLKEELKPCLQSFEVNKQNLFYFLSNQKYNFKETKTVYFDIKSAYLSVLYNSGLISDEIFNKISELPKKERLVCLGLLAYEPQFFEYENGKLKPSESRRIKNEFSNVFFWCVKEVSRIMTLCVQKLESDFGFFWVDGIFFKDTQENREAISEIFRIENVNFTVEETDITEIEEKENGISMKISYKDKEKNFFLPDNRKSKDEFKAKIAEIYRKQGELETKKELERIFILDKSGNLVF